MLEQIQARARRFRTRMVMRSALHDGWFFRWMKASVGRRFNERAAEWDSMVSEHEYKWFDPLDAALDRLPPGEILRGIADVGGGTGRAGYHIARTFPDARVTVVDLAPNMIAYGKRRQASESLPEVSFVAGDSAAIPFKDASVDLAYILNAPIFPDEMARVLRPGGHVVLAFTYGHHTPMYLDDTTATRALREAGFEDIETGQAGEGSWVLGRLPG